LKNLTFLNKIIFIINNVLALLFFASFILPYISPKTFPLLSVLSLAVPLLIFLHILFILYWWIIGVKKQFLLSALCIVLAISFSFFPYKFKGKNVISGSSFSVMNFNVRIFNRYQWIDDKNVPSKISDFIHQNNPDILTVQEYHPSKEISINYPYQYVELKGNKHNFGQAIFSKFKIINKGSLDFSKSSNNAIFVDILKNNDTIRIYNLHLESYGIKPKNVDLAELDEKESKKLLFRLTKSFTKQQSQVEQFISHKNNCNYKIIISGDLNNTAFSWAYHNVKGNLKDTFLEAGKGFGKTYSFNKYPLRIDFILVDEKFNVNQHQNFDINLSDHEPILTKLSY
jgi:endonuclease/exonuclease/phosphatase family metal-dependent hydrolase